jgi:hypothetical protein
MSRRRYLSTEISTDTRVNRLVLKAGDFAGLLYSWAIPHADDDGSLTADPEELLYSVLPGRRDKTPEDVARAVDEICGLGLMYRENGRLYFPPESFYRFQTYIPVEKRRSANNTEERRATPKNASSLSPLPPLPPSPSLSLGNPPSADPYKKDGVNRIEPAERLLAREPTRFQRLPSWIGKMRKEKYENLDISSALERLEDWEAKNGPVVDWYPWLTKIISKVRTERLQGHSTEFKRNGDPLQLGEIMNRSSRRATFMRQRTAEILRAGLDEE